MISAWELIKAKVARWTPGGPSVSDGIGTKRYMPYILAQSGVPVGLAPNGTIATNGTVTLGTALPTTYSDGIWLRFPANAVVGDTTGGIYWCVMSSTTVGTVYAGKIDASSAFTPYVGSTSGGAVTGSNSAYTQNTSVDVTLINVTIPANTMGLSGSLRSTARWSMTNNANAKAVYAILGSGVIMANTTVSTTNTGNIYTVRNRGVANRQISPSYSDTSSGSRYTSTNTTVDVALSMTAQIATATDYIIFDGLTIEVLPS